jgi:hypothetical protein
VGQRHARVLDDACEFLDAGDSGRDEIDDSDVDRVAFDELVEVSVEVRVVVGPDRLSESLTKPLVAP